MQHIEDILILVRDAVKNNINAELLAIETEKADGLDLERPLSTSYSINEKEVIEIFPYIMVIPDVSNTNIPANMWEEVSHSIIIIAHNVSRDGYEENCSLKTYRYARAISEIIKENNTLSDSVIGFAKTSIDYKPMMTDGNVYKQEVWVRCNVLTHEIIS